MAPDETLAVATDDDFRCAPWTAGQGPDPIGSATRFTQERFPFFARQAASIPIGSRILSPMIKKSNIVVLVFERLDLLLNKII